MSPSERTLWKLDGAEFYPCWMEDGIAWIWVDMSAARAAGQDLRPYFHGIRVSLLQPNSEGLPTNAEAEMLHKIEDYLFSLLEEMLNAVYVGRVTTNGYREFYFYAACEVVDESLFEQIAGRFQRYSFGAAEGQYDPTWSQYFECLYPNDLNHQYIVLFNTFQDLPQPPDPSQACSVDYFFYFDDEVAFDTVAAYIEELGAFQVEQARAAPLGHFRLTATYQATAEVQEIYGTYESLVSGNEDARQAFSHCEVDLEGFHFEYVEHSVRMRVAVDVSADLRQRLMGSVLACVRLANGKHCRAFFERACVAGFVRNRPRRWFREKPASS